MAICRAPEIQATTAELAKPDTPQYDRIYCRTQCNYSYVYRAYLQYDLSEIPYKSRIVSAKLRLYDYWKDDEGDSGLTNITRVTEAWDEETLCWNNKAATAGTYLSASVPPPGVGNWSDWDITTLVQEWVDQTNPNYGLMLVNDNDEWQYRYDWAFYNRRRPDRATYIEIEYEPEEELRISRVRMEELADQVRRITGSTEQMSLREMAEKLENLTTA